MRKIMLPLVALSIAAALQACAYIPASQQTVFDENAANTAAFDKKVQALPTAASDDVPVGPSVKTWIHAQAQTDQSFSDWAHGRNPTTQPN